MNNYSDANLSLCKPLKASTTSIQEYFIPKQTSRVYIAYIYMYIHWSHDLIVPLMHCTKQFFADMGTLCNTKIWLLE